MTAGAVLCLYLLTGCPAAPTNTRSAAPPPHDLGFWVIYLTDRTGREEAIVYTDAQDCSLDSAIRRDLGDAGAVCYELM